MVGAIAGDIVGSIYEWNRIKTKQFDLFSHAGLHYRRNRPGLLRRSAGVHHLKGNGNP